MDNPRLITLANHLAEGQTQAGNLIVCATGKPGSGGACHRYEIHIPHKDGNIEVVYIRFQDGPIQEVGINGVTHEALLAIVEHRLDCFQRGPLKCADNQLALDGVKTALRFLHNRTANRRARKDLSVA